MTPVLSPGNQRSAGAAALIRRYVNRQVNGNQPDYSDEVWRTSEESLAWSHGKKYGFRTQNSATVAW